jgi:hypothetical protein
MGFQRAGVKILSCFKWNKDNHFIVKLLSYFQRKITENFVFNVKWNIDEDVYIYTDGETTLILNKIQKYKN